MNQAVIATDLTGQINYWNRFAENLYGWPAAEAIGRDILEVIVTHFIGKYEMDFNRAD